jgi:hypothetical protein
MIKDYLLTTHSIHTNTCTVDYVVYVFGSLLQSGYTTILSSET